MQKPLNSHPGDYIDDLPAGHKNIVLQLHQLILQLYPEAEVDMSSRMPTYKARTGWIALASQKHYVSLYTCSAAHISEFKRLYPAIKTGKACINFKAADPLPLDALKAVIQHAIETPH